MKLNYRVLISVLLAAAWIAFWPTPARARVTRLQTLKVLTESGGTVVGGPSSHHCMRATHCDGPHHSHPHEYLGFQHHCQRGTHCPLRHTDPSGARRGLPMPLVEAVTK